jgi:hypothetical protein
MEIVDKLFEFMYRVGTVCDMDEREPKPPFNVGQSLRLVITAGSRVLMKLARAT